MHCAIIGASLDSIKYLWEHGADIHAPTAKYRVPAYDFCCKRMSACTNAQQLRRFVEVKSYLREKYFIDKRGHEVRKFIWVYSQLNAKSQSIGFLPQSLARETAEFI